MSTRATTPHPSHATPPDAPSSACEATLDRLLERIRRERFPDGVRCPHCSCRRVHRHGTASRRQRYKCTDCTRTFNDLTGTPAAYLKKLQLWPPYVEGMEWGESLRAAGLRLGIHPSTAFRWRHRLLGEFVARDDEVLREWIEFAVYSGFPLSKKGTRWGLGRPARTHRLRRPWSRGLPPEVAWVAVAADGKGHVVTDVVRQPFIIQEEELERILGPRIRPGPAGQPPVLVVRPLSRSGPYHRFIARRGGVVFSDGSGTPAELLPRVSLDTVFWYWRRLQRWMCRFFGVATRYLRHYLRWHRWVERFRGYASITTLFSWPLGTNPS